MHLYEYSGIGHFWMKSDEDLRVMEYQIAILRDKCHYLGEVYCTEKERQLASFADFPPLNSCSYPAVPKQYRVGNEDPKEVSPEAIKLMETFTVAQDDLDFHVYLLIWQNGWHKDRVTAEEIKQD